VAVGFLRAVATGQRLLFTHVMTEAHVVSLVVGYELGPWVLLGGLAGVLGAAAATATLLAMDGGFAPVVTAYAAVRRVEESAVSRREALVAFHCFGGGCGLVYILLWPWFAEVRPLGIYPTFADAGLVGAVVYVLFASVALPRSSVDRSRRRAVRGQWLLAACVFAVSLSHGYAYLESLVA
jgi:hypothetical protein